MMFFDRKNCCVAEESENGQKSLKFLYHTAFGRFLLKILTLPFVSNLVRCYKASRLSRRGISKFARKNGIAVSEEAMASFRSFNDFFIRKEERTFREEPNVLCAPADSKLSVFPITPELRLDIKNSTYSVAELLEDEEMAKHFAGGVCLVFRLAVDDMHRYGYFDDGEIISNKKIPGRLHTVQAISEEYRVYARNKREVTMMKTSNFGIAAQIEIGALVIGRIVNHEKTAFRRGEEKGYFEFGGSTVVLLLQDMPRLDADILEANEKGLETRVSAGERIGEKA